MASNSNVEQCLRLIRELRASIGNAKRIPLRNDVAMVNPDELMRKLTRLDEILPTAIHTAQEYVTNISSIQQQAEQECDTRLRNAKQSEEQILSEANRTADRLKQEAEQYYQEKTAAANREAANAVSFANQEAARIKADAARQAESMVQSEDIYQRAKARA